MTYVRRLRVVGAVLALTAIFTNSHVWGESAKKPPEKRRSDTPRFSKEKDQDIAEDLANTKFAKASVLTYRTSGGETLFAEGRKAARRFIARHGAQIGVHETLDVARVFLSEPRLTTELPANEDSFERRMRHGR